MRSRRALTSSIIYSEHTKWFYIPTDRSRVTAIMRGDKAPRHLLWRVVGRGADHDPPGRSMMRGPTVLTSGHSSMASAGGSTPAGLGGHGPWFSGVRAPELATNRQGMPWIVAGLWSRCGNTSYTKPSSGIRLAPAAFLIWSVSAISGLVAYLVAFWPSKSSPKVTSPQASFCLGHRLLSRHIHGTSFSSVVVIDALASRGLRRS